MSRQRTKYVLKRIAYGSVTLAFAWFFSLQCLEFWTIYFGLVAYAFTVLIVDGLVEWLDAD